MFAFQGFSLVSLVPMSEAAREIVIEGPEGKEYVWWASFSNSKVRSVKRTAE